MERPTEPCHTCRRYRVKCDRSVPFCQKCLHTGRECLGYQKKLIRWNQGIASRGKLMGRTSPSQLYPTSRPCKVNSLLSNFPFAPSFHVAPLSVQSLPPTDAQSLYGVRWNTIPAWPKIPAERVYSRMSPTSLIPTDAHFQGLDRASQYYLYYCMHQTTA